MALWLLLSVALPAVLTLMGTYWRQGWLIVMAILLAALLIWLALRALLLPFDPTVTPSRTPAQQLSLLFAAAGATFGLLPGWLTGRAFRGA